MQQKMPRVYQFFSNITKQHFKQQFELKQEYLSQKLLIMSYLARCNKQSYAGYCYDIRNINCLTKNYLIGI